MKSIEFLAKELTKENEFLLTKYCFRGSVQKGWKIYRNNTLSLDLSSGYVLTKVLYCGICSTDLVRTKLPFPLPQIIGHEVVVEKYDDKSGDHTLYVVEINASHRALGLPTTCSYCTGNSDTLDIHCPSRLTLGIDRLPGGLSPYLLAPIHSLVPCPSVFSDVHVYTLIEPFAAAFHAVEMVMDKYKGHSQALTVAVVGIGTLGLLVLHALNIYRDHFNDTPLNISYSLYAIGRHPLPPMRREFCGALGVAEIIEGVDVEGRTFDICFDTSGSPSGLLTSLRCALREIHVKSTHGSPVLGVSHFTQFVVDELTLLPIWLHEQPVGSSIYLSPSLSIKEKREITQRFPLASCYHQVQNGVGKFDYGVVSTACQIDDMLASSLIHERGSIFYLPNEKDPLFVHLCNRGVILSSSRCGNFRRVTTLLDQHPKDFFLWKKLISVFPYELLERVFHSDVRNDQNVKCVIRLLH